MFSGRFTFKVALLAALLAVMPARAQDRGSFERDFIAPMHLSCLLCSNAMGLIVSVLPIAGAVLSHSPTARTPIWPALPMLSLAAFTYTGLEALLLLGAEQSRPWDHWLILMSVRLLGTAMGYLAGRFLDTGGTVLVTGVLCVGSALPQFLLETERTSAQLQPAAVVPVVQGTF